MLFITFAVYNIKITFIMEDTVSKRSKLIERLSKNEKFKNKQYADDDVETLYGDLDSFLEEQEGSVQNATQFKTELVELFKQYPDVYEFIQAIMDAPEGLSEDEILAFALNTVFSQEEIQEIFNSDKDVIKGIRENKSAALALRQEIENNLENFQPALDAFATENNIDEAKKEGFLAFLETTIPEMIKANFSPDLLKKLYQAFIFEDEVGAMEEDKTIAGKNQEQQPAKAPIMPDVNNAQAMNAGGKGGDLIDLVANMNKKR